MFCRKKIKVTPNVEYCLKVFGNAVNALPEGDLKAKAKAAHDYLRRTASGERQPYSGDRYCDEEFLIPREK